MGFARVKAVGPLPPGALRSGSGSVVELHAQPRHSHYSLISDLDGLKSLQADWRRLEQGSGRSHNVFQSFDWCYAWAKTYTGGGRELSIVAGHRGGELVFVWPLMKVKHGPFSVLRWLSEPFGQYGDILIATDEDPKSWLAGAFGFIKKLKGISTLRLRHVREDASCYEFLRKNFHWAHMQDAAPFLDLTAFPTEESYEQRYSKEQRKRRRKIRKELESQGSVEFTLLRTGSDMDAAMQAALREKHKWLTDRGLFSRALNCPLLYQFLKELSRSGGPEDRLVTSLLTAGGRPISWEIGLRFKDRHCGFITAHDTSLTDASPARLHMDLAQRRALADGMRTFDLMVPNDPHKESWSNGTMAVHDFYAPVSVLGQIYGRCYLSGLRPILRYAYYNAPPSLRHILTRAVKLKASLRH